MPWIKVDDHYDEHPKFAQAGPLAAAMWLAGMAYCNRNLTDGFIPWGASRNLVSWTFLDGAGPATIYIGKPDFVHESGEVTSEYVIELLLHAGLWTECSGGFRVHDYEQYQPTREQIEADRAAKAAAGRAGGIAAAVARAKAGGRPRGRAGAVAKSKPVPVPVPSAPNGALSGERLSDEEQREQLDKLRGTLAELGAFPEKKANGERKPYHPTTDTEVIERARAVIADEDAPQWKRDAARAQLEAMRVQP